MKRITRGMATELDKEEEKKDDGQGVSQIFITGLTAKLYRSQASGGPSDRWSSPVGSSTLCGMFSLAEVSGPALDGSGRANMDPEETGGHFPVRCILRRQRAVTGLVDSLGGCHVISSQVNLLICLYFWQWLKTCRFFF